VSDSPRPLKTKEVLDATGITHQVLYRYVTMGLIEEEVTQESGHRLFPPDTVAAIQLIQRLNQTGYTLRDIKDIFFKDERLDQVRERVRQAEERRSEKPAERETHRREG
jgi:DNA-binding transcriptional MerR regulator